MPETARGPDLFIVGKHKAGTRVLADMLNQHPEVFIPPRELHHFESDLQVQRIVGSGRLRSRTLARWNARRSDYLRNYADVSPSVRVLGDRSPSYLQSVTAAAEIAEFNSSAKVIALFREPLSFLRSLHAQNLYNQYEDEPDFVKALALEPQRRGGRRLPSGGRHVPYMLHYRDHLNYAAQLARFLKHCPRQNVKVVIYERFRAENHGCVAQLFGFLGVDPTFVPEVRTMNPNRIRAYPRLTRIVKAVAGTGVPSRVLPRQAHARLSEHFKSASTKIVARGELPPDDVGRLRESFALQVLEFHSLLVREGLVNEAKAVAEWDYPLDAMAHGGLR